MIFTPVGIRCKHCAQLRRPPQFDVGIDRLILAALVGLGTSLLAWGIALEAYFLVWFLSIFVGLAVGEVASRAVRRRDNLWLEVIVGGAIVVGYLVMSGLITGLGFLFRSGLGSIAAVSVGVMSFSIIPLALAVIAGVTRLRR